MKINIKNKYLLFLCCFIFQQSANAEITTDGTTGIKANIAASNNEYQITENLGTKSGGNLFHSFSTFNVEANNTAIFSGSGDITNVITRVTGNSASNINGAINSSIEGANFWLLNPNGVIIGKNASFDISGSVNLSTANYLSFLDGEIYSTSPGVLPETLSMSSPASFGFLTDNSSSIVFDQADLIFQDNKLVLVSRSVTFSNSNIRLENSALNIVATNGQTTIELDQLGTMEFTGDDYGDVNLVSTEIISKSGTESESALPVVIKARKLDMVDSNISNLQSNATNADVVEISVDVIAMAQSTIQSSTIENLMNNSDTSGINVNAVHFASQNNNLPVTDNIIVVDVNEQQFNENGPNIIIENGQTLDVEIVKVDVSENKMPDSEREVHNLVSSPCGDVENSSTFSVKNESYTYTDPMAFSPGSHYQSLDVNYNSNSSSSSSSSSFRECGA